MSQLQSYFLFLLILYTVFIGGNSIDPQVDLREKGSSQNNVTLMLPQKTNLTQNATQEVISEGGVEQVVEQPKTNVTTETVKNVTSIKKDDITVGKPAGNNTNLTLRKDKPVHEESNEPPEVPTLLHDFEKPIVPKKGVNFSESDLDSTGKKNISAKTANSSTIIHHKKPSFTESDSDFIDTNTDKENILTVDQIDPLLADKNYNRSDYIVPIVAVILSVPLVAILASLVYKRGADWWQHRNYKRMDFLIEGIYHHQ